MGKRWPADTWDREYPHRGNISPYAASSRLGNFGHGGPSPNRGPSPYGHSWERTPYGNNHVHSGARSPNRVSPYGHSWARSPYGHSAYSGRSAEHRAGLEHSSGTEAKSLKLGDKIFELKNGDEERKEVFTGTHVRGNELMITPWDIFPIQLTENMEFGCALELARTMNVNLAFFGGSHEFGLPKAVAWKFLQSNLQIGCLFVIGYSETGASLTLHNRSLREIVFLENARLETCVACHRKLMYLGKESDDFTTLNPDQIVDMVGNRYLESRKVQRVFIVQVCLEWARISVFVAGSSAELARSEKIEDLQKAWSSLQSHDRIIGITDCEQLASRMIPIVASRFDTRDLADYIVCIAPCGPAPAIAFTTDSNLAPLLQTFKIASRMRTRIVNDYFVDVTSVAAHQWNLLRTCYGQLVENNLMQTMPCGFLDIGEHCFSLSIMNKAIADKASMQKATQAVFEIHDFGTAERLQFQEKVLELCADIPSSFKFTSWRELQTSMPFLAIGPNLLNFAETHHAQLAPKCLGYLKPLLPQYAPFGETHIPHYQPFGGAPFGEAQSLDEDDRALGYLSDRGYGYLSDREGNFSDREPDYDRNEFDDYH